MLEALEEHHLVKVSLRELEDLDPTEERFDAKVTVLIEHVRHHVKEEESDLFPKVRQQLGRRRLQELGDELRAARSGVPTPPHPGAPDEPPGNALIGGAVAVVDRAELSVTASSGACSTSCRLRRRSRERRARFAVGAAPDELGPFADGTEVWSKASS